MRAIWKGAISFGLVNIPIALYPATSREEFKFRMLRASDLSSINFKRIAEADGKEVPWEEIVKGYEYEPGRFVVLKEEDFARIDIEATRTVDITDFVRLEEVDPMYFRKPYYMEPAKGGEKAYVLLHDALAESGKIGIAKVVIKTREYLASVKPAKRGLVLELMHFADELVDASQVKVPENREISKKEMEMARALIEGMSSEWRPEKYKDDYNEALLRLIDEKVEHGGKLPGKPKSAPHPGGVIDLVSVLQESLKKTQAAQRAGKGKSSERISSKGRKRAA
jgi:DNA end-binding protein Ku